MLFQQEIQPIVLFLVVGLMLIAVTQGRRTGGTSSNVVSIICLLVETGLTDLPKSGGAPPTPTALHKRG